MQLNKNTEVAKLLKETNPWMLEESVWSANNSDYAVYVPIVENDLVLTKDDVTTLDFMEAVKTVYNNWVLPGTNKDLGYSDVVTHNVSNTITVNDWDEVFNYIFDNQESFCGLSFMAGAGDKVYKQSPFTKVKSFEEIVEEYGKGVLLTSGLIMDALHDFDNDLWEACEYAKHRDRKFTGDRRAVLLKKDIVRRIKQFSRNYFNNDLDKTIECLKDVYLFHKFETISRKFKDIDFLSINTKPGYTEIASLGAVACSGGACEITTL